MIGRLKERYPFLVNSGYASASAASNVLLLVLLVIAARWLSVDDYGRFGFALSLVTIVEMIMDIGLGPVTIREVARDRSRADQLFRDVLGLKLAWVSSGLFILAIAAPVLRYQDPLVIRICYLMGLSSAVRSYLLTTRGLLQGLDRFDLEALLVIADRVFLLAAGGAVLVAGDGVMALAIAFVAARALLLLVVFALVRRFLGPIAPAFNRARWRDLHAAAIPLGLWLITLSAYNYIDTVILGVMRTDAEVAWYRASYSLYEGLAYAPAALSAVVTPRLSNLFIRDRGGHGALLHRTLAVSVGLGFLLGGTTWLLSGWIVPFIYGQAYEPAVAPLRILAAGSVFVFTTWVLHAGAISVNLDRRLLVTTIVGLTANVALNLVLIPRYGISGAAWATVLAEALTAAVLFVQIERAARQ